MADIGRSLIQAQLTMGDPGPLYYVQHPGFGGHIAFADYADVTDPTNVKDPIFQYMSEGDIGWKTDCGVWNASTNSIQVPVMRVIPNPVGAVTLQPYLEQSLSTGNTQQNVDLTYFQALGSEADYWTDGWDGAYLPFHNWPLMVNLSSNDPYLPRTLQSLFDLPPQPVFAFGLWRAEPPEDMGDTSAGTMVYFSEGSDGGYVCEYGLHIPFDGEMVMYYKHGKLTDGNWRKMRVLKEGSINVRQYSQGSLRTTEKETTIVWVGWFGDKLCVSKDGFASLSAVYSTQLTDPFVYDGVHYPFGTSLMSFRSPVRFVHYGGQMGISWIPIRMAPRGIVQSPVHPLAFALEDMTTSSYLSIGPWAHLTDEPSDGALQNVIPNQYAAWVLDGQESRAAKRRYSNGLVSGHYGFDWKLQINGLTWAVDVPHHNWAGTDAKLAFPSRNPGVYYHDRACAVHRVDYWTDTELHRRTVTTANYEMEQFSGDLTTGASSASVAVDNEGGDGTMAGPFRGLHKYHAIRPVSSTPQWVNHLGEPVHPAPETIASPFQGYMYSPRSTLEGNVVATEFQFEDYITAAMGATIDGTLPPFDGWRVSTAIKWLLHYIGIGPDMYTGLTWVWDGTGWAWEELDFIEDTGERLSIGPAGKPFWKGEEGRPVVDLISEMCVYDWGAAFLCTKGTVLKGCPHCLVQRMPWGTSLGSGGYVGSHVSMGPASPGCRSWDVAWAALSGWGNGIRWRFLTSNRPHDFNRAGITSHRPFEHECSRIEVDSSETRSKHHNSVHVQGSSQLNPDDPPSVEATNWESVRGQTGTGSPSNPWGYYSLGFKQKLMLSYPWANRPDILQRIALINWMNMPWQFYANVTVPYDPLYRVGDVFTIHGSQAMHIGCDNQMFRIKGISHGGYEPTSRMNTVLKGVWIGVAP